MSNDTMQQRTVETEVVGDQVVQREVIDQKNPAKTKGLNKTIQILYYVEGVIMALLGLRFVLRLLGASAASGFVGFIYGLTYPLVYPFFGMFRTVLSYGAARLEFETLIAMLVYGILAWILVGLVRIGK
ncbi:MAG: YggT family protein [bacterium]|nr:YggT family protein [bacterium]